MNDSEKRDRQTDRDREEEIEKNEYCEIEKERVESENMCRGKKNKSRWKGAHLPVEWLFLSISTVQSKGIFCTKVSSVTRITLSVIEMRERKRRRETAGC